MAKQHPEFDRPFRDWLADRVSDFAQQLRNEEDPEVTFTATVGELPRVSLQIRLIDLEGVYTREEIPIEIIEDGRHGG